MKVDVYSYQAILQLVCAVAIIWDVTIKQILDRSGRPNSRLTEARQAILLLLAADTRLSSEEKAEILNRGLTTIRQETYMGRKRREESARFRLLVETAERYWLTGTEPQPHPAAMLRDEAWATMNTMEVTV